MESDLTAAFDEIVAALDKLPACEARAAGGDRCPNPAWWHATVHGCGSGLVCTWHLRAFLRQGSGGPMECNQCGTVFDSITDAVTLVEL